MTSKIYASLKAKADVVGSSYLLPLNASDITASKDPWTAVNKTISLDGDKTRLPDLVTAWYATKTWTTLKKLIEDALDHVKEVDNLPIGIVDATSTVVKTAVSAATSKDPNTERANLLSSLQHLWDQIELSSSIAENFLTGASSFGDNPLSLAATISELEHLAYLDMTKSWTNQVWEYLNRDQGENEARIIALENVVQDHCSKANNWDAWSRLKNMRETKQRRFPVQPQHTFEWNQNESSYQWTSISGSNDSSDAVTLNDACFWAVELYYDMNVRLKFIEPITAFNDQLEKSVHFLTLIIQELKRLSENVKAVAASCIAARDAVEDLFCNICADVPECWKNDSDTLTKAIGQLGVAISAAVNTPTGQFLNSDNWVGCSTVDKDSPPPREAGSIIFGLSGLDCSRNDKIRVLGEFDDTRGPHPVGWSTKPSVADLSWMRLPDMGNAYLSGSIKWASDAGFKYEDAGSDSRWKQYINFSGVGFSPQEEPVVRVWLQGLEIERDCDVHIRLDPVDVGRSGFTLNIVFPKDSRFKEVQIGWLAHAKGREEIWSIEKTFSKNGPYTGEGCRWPGREYTREFGFAPKAIGLFKSLWVQKGTDTRVRTHAVYPTNVRIHLLGTSWGDTMVKDMTCVFILRGAPKVR